MSGTQIHLPGKLGPAKAPKKAGDGTSGGGGGTEEGRGRRGRHRVPRHIDLILSEMAPGTSKFANLYFAVCVLVMVAAVATLVLSAATQSKAKSDRFHANSSRRDAYASLSPRQVEFEKATELADTLDSKLAAARSVENGYVGIVDEFLVVAENARSELLANDRTGYDGTVRDMNRLVGRLNGRVGETSADWSALWTARNDFARGMREDEIAAVRQFGAATIEFYGFALELRPVAEQEAERVKKEEEARRRKEEQRRAAAEEASTPAPRPVDDDDDD